MTTLVNITSSTPDAVQIWGFHDICDVSDVAAALNEIAAGLSGDANTIHVMSGTHGYCGGQVGAVATREQKFAEEDRALAHPKTKDNKAVAVVVHDFNTGKLPTPDYVSAAMAKLNTDIRSIVKTDTREACFPPRLLLQCRYKVDSQIQKECRSTRLLSMCVSFSASGLILLCHK
ncbi:hypothetical protein M3I54_38205 [Paraburkholderia sp. CNPSo 3274]|uniref:hypothetical protein n=1 Tax=Paraburkholderia sp. CNPSo 3274 TaxID=2940932 RepID=UPI0020B77712|nr:hypothetical protein [Paraburkholderia sp. CNPSo 3274]MCP3712681.1 hypothetical protein [Paraburkholderia sp. CNPSo 3274]